MRNFCFCFLHSKTFFLFFVYRSTKQYPKKLVIGRIIHYTLQRKICTTTFVIIYYCPSPKNHWGHNFFWMGKHLSMGKMTSRDLLFFSWKEGTRLVVFVFLGSWEWMQFGWYVIGLAPKKKNEVHSFVNN